MRAHPEAFARLATLGARLLAVLDQVAMSAATLPEPTLHESLPGRKRTRLDLAHQLGCAVEEPAA